MYCILCYSVYINSGKLEAEKRLAQRLFNGKYIYRTHCAITLNWFGIGVFFRNFYFHKLSLLLYLLNIHLHY